MFKNAERVDNISCLNKILLLGCKLELMELRLEFPSAHPETHLALRKFTHVHHQ